MTTRPHRPRPDDDIQSTNDPFVDWVREATPYIHAHRGRTFVIAFGGEAVVDARFPELVHDIALLHGLGIRLVLVHGARPQIEQRLQGQGVELRYVNGLRVTDDRALACVKEAAGMVRVEIEALLSLGLANSPMAGVRIPVVSGNFVTARPLGVIDGVDYAHTGAVRRVDHRSLRLLLDQGMVALMPPLGYSPTGEVFNLSAADVARSAAVALGADKLIFLTESAESQQGARLAPNLLAREVDALLAGTQMLPDEIATCLRAGAEACRHGIRRVHLVERGEHGALLRELFTHDGHGTLISAEPYEDLRPARIDDVTGILELLRPMEERGVLVRRSRERLETEIDCFHIAERDGLVTACAALYPYPHDDMAELACLAVHQDYRGGRRGERLLEHIEGLTRARGIGRLFVLTTQTAHWFQERGFQPSGLEALPMEKRALYNFQRNSKVFIKTLPDCRSLPKSP
ncbi:amino-acid N-acetyltransferase [Allochromatium palmeri]|uniref:Amino-acid acetyltransferase n=1 Tax=Allochromatium palmeri TaxID=231048 RepID=A0A6N8EHY1_9GAMM|nr:amino-acid N-acetyltransferase [Allochromatium palmeri]MTW21934.1 amino-acid N-acetyltransferase [Allochromatium palmeri]